MAATTQANGKQKQLPMESNKGKVFCKFLVILFFFPQIEASAIHILSYFYRLFDFYSTLSQRFEGEFLIPSF